MSSIAPLIGGEKADESSASWSSTTYELISLAVPNALREVLIMCNEVTNMLMLSRMTSDTDVIAAVGLGNMMQNVFGLSIGLGLLSAFDTFVSQAYGAGDHKSTVEVLQRGRLIVTFQLVWIAPVLYFSGDMLCAIGQNVRVAEYAGQYNRVSLLGIPGFFWQEAFKSFLGNRSVAVAPLVVTTVTSALHVVWCAYFVLVCRLGNVGAGIANAITWNLGFLILLGYVMLTAGGHGLSRRALVGTSRSAWREWRHYLAIGVPSMLQVCGEWWFWEICALVVGYLGTVPLAAHVGTLNLITLVFMPILGISQSAAALVGQCVGAKCMHKAFRVVTVSLCMALISTSCLGAISVIFRHAIAKAYSQDASTQATIVTLLLIYFPFTGAMDAVQNVMGGIMRGLGQQRAALFIYVFCFYGVMLPVGCLLAFPLGIGVAGIWYAMAAGLLLADVMFLILLYFTKRDEHKLVVAQVCRGKAKGFAHSEQDPAQEWLDDASEPVPASAGRPLEPHCGTGRGQLSAADVRGLCTPGPFTT